ncbi:uncharacterized protein NPIL_451231 [Nephila pilipes]|uniref:EGF-like domain-containing protein n=1 Tax=Nephila pilipes TaxID=299642 RepID=A0A8X6THE9_NEPPI|nr:uncharacterized protein NPIL_451231 [Nephila pilipes]
MKNIVQLFVESTLNISVIRTFFFLSAICKNGCVNGICVAPNTCSCKEGWQGSNCTIECEDGWYGEGCKMYCSCKNGAICDKKNGICYCAPGFVGTFCESACPNESYGRNCDNECKCLNGGLCNQSDETCICPPGYIGEKCERQCEEGFYGEQCNGNCSCNELSTIFCSHVDGKCMCIPGWKGDSCSKRCDLNTWGVHCSNKCNCPFNSICDPITGKCTCRPGWYGPQCEEKCPAGFFGKECKMKCPDCVVQTGTCHHVTGWCSCPAGARGSNCDLECPDNKYGDNCDNDCLCANNSTCDPITGNCSCTPGWIGEDCSLPCPLGFYGLNCSFICHCADNSTCDFINGTCKCEGDSNNPICMNQMAQNFNSSTIINETAFSNLSIILLDASVVFGILLFVFFVFCITRKLRRPTLNLHKEDASTAGAFQETSSPSISSFRFTNPNYVSADILRKFNKRSSELFPASIIHQKDDDVAVSDEEFGIPDCDKASSMKRSNIKVCNELSRKESKGEVTSPQIRYSKSAQIFCFPPDETSSQENVYADVEYETRNYEKSEESVK